MQTRLSDWIEHFWIAKRPLCPQGINSQIADTPLARRTALILWPIVPFLVFYKTYVLAFRHPKTDDFANLYLAMRRFANGEPVYSEIYRHTDPHYIYNPGATLLLSPFGYLDNYPFPRTIFIIINTICIIAALGILTRLFGFQLRQFVWPASIILLLLSEAGDHTLKYANINGVLLLGLCIFFWGFIRNHSILAGVALGLAVLFKPMLAPLVLLAIIGRRWLISFLTIVTPILINIIAWPPVPNAKDYITIVVPYLKITRNYANYSIPGTANIFGISPYLFYAWWIIVAVAAGFALVILARWRFTDTLLWLVSSTSIITVSVTLLSNLGQTYYSIYAFPLVFTVFYQRGLLHNPFVAFSFISFNIYLSYTYISLQAMTFYCSLLQYTVAWSLFVISAAVVTLFWWKNENKQPRKTPHARPQPSLQRTMA